MKRIYLGVFLVSMASLSLQVTLTRIISVKLWYHFSYLIISIALLGYGAAGSRLTVSNGLKDEQDTYLLAKNALLFAVMSLAGPILFGLINLYPPEHAKLMTQPFYWLLSR